MTSPSPTLPRLVTLLDAIRAGRGAVLACFEESLRVQGLHDARIMLSAPDEPPLQPAAHSARIDGGTLPRGAILCPSMEADALEAWAEAIAAAMQAADHLAALTQEAATDSLTGAGNRRAFEEYIQRAIEAAADQARPLKLMLFDIDDFKSYNDRFGHAAGDEVLRETVSLLRSVIRRGDAVFRLGGDEFVVVFGDPDSPRSSGSPPLLSVDQMAVRFAEGIKSLHLPALGESGLGRVTVSAGIAGFPEDGLDATALLAAADRRAFESKHRGKCTITFGPDRP
jgi:diguanylate cyclase (GGDEF)-like protein